MKLKLFASSLLVVTFSVHANTLNGILKEYNISIKSGPFITTKNQKQTGVKKSRHLIEAKSSTGEVIKIEIIKPIIKKKAMKLIQRNFADIETLYQPTQTPYMNDISQAFQGCPTPLQLLKTTITFRNRKVDAIVGGAEEYLLLGACTPAKVKFKGAYFSYYDVKTKSVWSWNIFVPWKYKDKALSASWLNRIVSKIK